MAGLHSTKMELLAEIDRLRQQVRTLEQSDVERKRGAEECVALERELQHAHKLEAIGTLAAGIAHEINTPIQFIGDNTRFISITIAKLFNLMRMYQHFLPACEWDTKVATLVRKIRATEKKIKFSFLEKEIPEAVSHMQEGVERVTRIVNAMKEFSHMSSEEKEVEDINAAILNTVTISRNEWKYVSELEVDLEEGALEAECFVADIKQVLLNLILNAADTIRDVVAGKKGGRGLIKITSRKKGDTVVIQVSDTGTGIPVEIQNKIFDPFFTTKEVGKGTGQGLSLVYASIVEKHGGKITFKTTKGKGTTFTITLPVSEPKD